MLADHHGRQFKYLRLSVTEKCNFRCSYCLPNGYSPKHNSLNQNSTNSFLSLNEINNLVQVFSDLGVEKIRLTGGEPTLRSDIVSIVETIKDHSPVKTVALTTNGFRLNSILCDLKLAGLDALNISLDSLNQQKFNSLTGSDLKDQILKTIEQAIKLNFSKIKINCVLLKDINDIEFLDFLQFVKNKPVSVRFIELMQTNDNSIFFKKHHMSVSSLQNVLMQMGWEKLSSVITDGPAQEYQHPEYMGRIGVISPYSKNFCQNCNRLRISATGRLRLCLFGQGDFELRPYLQDKSQFFELQEKIFSVLPIKKAAHQLHENIFGDMSSLSTIGG